METRMEKWKELRDKIEEENKRYRDDWYLHGEYASQAGIEWRDIFCNQERVKRNIGAKH